MQDTLNQAVLKDQSSISFTARELAAKLHLDWRTFYKYINSKGYTYLAEDQLPSLVIEEIIRKSAQPHYKRPIKVTNAARTLAKNLGIKLEDYTQLAAESTSLSLTEKSKGSNTRLLTMNNEKGKARHKKIQPPNPISPALNTKSETSIKLPSLYLVLLYLSALVFVAFDGFSAAFIVMKTYVDVGDSSQSLLVAIQSIKTNPIILYGSITGALAGIFIGFIAIGSIVHFKEKNKWKNGKDSLKVIFALYQLVLHFTAMPQKNAGMIVFSLGLTLGTYGVTVAIDNKLNNEA